MLALFAWLKKRLSKPNFAKKRPAMISLVPRFSITFDVTTNSVTFTDTTALRTANTVGIIKVTNVNEGTILYQHPNWGASPSAWVSPDIDGSIPKWSKAVSLGGMLAGDYKFEVKLYDSTGGYVPLTIPIVLRKYRLIYTSPVVCITENIKCRTSQLISSDVTDYNIVTDGIQLSPSTLTRSHTITPPAGCGYTGTLGTTNDAIRTVGGGSTPGTYLWTRVWQTNISTVLKYNLAAWSDTLPEVSVTDLVKGDANTFAQCDATICALAQCYRNMLDRWNASLTQNFTYREKYRDKVVLANALWTLLEWYDHCGIDTEVVILRLKELLAEENCTCTASNEEVSTPIIPWGPVVSSGGGSSSEFMFHIETTVPGTSDGHDGDVWYDKSSGDLYLKAGGAWTLKDNIKGAKGDAGNAVDQKMLVLVHDTTSRATPATLSISPVSYDFQINNSQFNFSNDFMRFVYDVKLAHNQNGKRLTLQFAGDDIMTYFTDDLANDTNDRVTVSLKVTPINNVSQHLEATIVRGGIPGQMIGPKIIRNNSKDLNTTRSVKLCATNSVAQVNDIICDCTLVELYHRETTFLASGPPLSTGRGLISQKFISTEGQTDFVVTDFEPNDYYMPQIDDTPVSQVIVTRSGYVFTYAPGLHAGQVLLIVD